MGVIMEIRMDGMPQVRELTENLSPQRWKSAFFPMAGQIVTRAIMRNFEAEGRPQRWAPLKWQTIRGRFMRHKTLRKFVSSPFGGATARAGKGKIAQQFQRGFPMAKPLQDTGRLKASVGSVAKGGVNRIEGDMLLIGTRINYAATHQFGNAARNVPARPFMVLPPEEERAVAQAAEAIIRRVIEGRQ